MKVCSTCKQEKPYEEFPKRKESKDGYRGTCQECRNAKGREWHQKNPEWLKARRRGYFETYKEKNLEVVLERDREYSRKNRSKKSENFKKWRHNNPEKAKATQKRNSHLSVKWAEDNIGRVRELQKNWRDSNRDKVRESAAARRAREVQATPSWLTKEHRKEILAYYKEAKVREEFHETPHHVDHIEPLKGVDENREHVSSGLHVPWNLQVLPATENLKKGNKLN